MTPFPLIEVEGGSIGIADVKNTLADDLGAPYAVCRPPIPDDTAHLSATVATIVMTPAAGVMEISPLPALGTKFSRYHLTECVNALR